MINYNDNFLIIEPIMYKNKKNKKNTMFNNNNLFINY